MNFTSPHLLQYHGNIFNCIHQVYMFFLHYHYWRRYLGISETFLFFVIPGLLMFLPLAQCEGKVLLLHQHLWQRVLSLIRSMLTLQNLTEIRQLFLSGPSPNYQNIPLIKEILKFVLFRQWKALLQIPVRTLIMKFKANLLGNYA